MKKKIIISLLILIVVLVSICLFKFNTQPKSFGSASQKATDVSIINLIATPEKYDGKSVRIMGVASFGFESNGLYLSYDDYKHSNTKNAVWLSVDEKILNVTPRELKSFNGKYILLEGIFNSENTGHFDMYSGSIEKITRIEYWK